jgi:hypothetical protein
MPDLQLRRTQPSRTHESPSRAQLGRWLVVALLVVTIAGAWLSPFAHAGLLLINLVASAFVLGLQSILSWLPRQKPIEHASKREPSRFTCRRTTNRPTS